MADTEYLQEITMACPDCDLLNRVPELAPGESASCGRCDLGAGCPGPPGYIGGCCALLIAAVILYIPAKSPRTANWSLHWEKLWPHTL